MPACFKQNYGRFIPNLDYGKTLDIFYPLKLKEFCKSIFSSSKIPVWKKQIFSLLGLLEAVCEIYAFPINISLVLSNINLPVII